MPDSPVPPSFDEREESTLHGVEDVPKPLRKWAESQSRRTRKLEKHFEPDGMVTELRDDMRFVKTLFTRFFPLSLPFILALLAGIYWLIQVSQPKPAAPEPIDYDRIGRTAAKHMKDANQ